MKVLLIYPDISSWSALNLGNMGFSGWYNFGLGYISTALKKADINVSLYHILSMPNERQFLNRIRLEDPDLIGLYLNSNNLYYLNFFLSWLKNGNIKTKLICGGPHPSLNPEETIRLKGVDMLCVGEGDEAIVEVCQKIEQGENTKKIKNIWVKEGEDIYRNEPRPLIKELDSLGFPDKEIFNLRSLEFFKMGTGVFLASRGCPYSCNYCCNHALSQVYKGEAYVRFRGVDSVLSEVSATLSKYGDLKSVVFEDNILPLDKQWFYDFCVKYKKIINKPLEINSSANFIDEERVALMKECGCTNVRIGVESGNEQIRNEVLGKKISNAQIAKAFELLKKSGIKTTSYNMVGIPFEKPNNIFETIEFNSSIKTDESIAQICHPYKKTKLYELCKTNKIIKSKVIPNINRENIIDLTGINVKLLVLIKAFYPYLVKFHIAVSKLQPAVIRNIAINFFKKIILSPILATFFYYPLLLFLDLYRLRRSCFRMFYK